jgi:hypothetical protein
MIKATDTITVIEGYDAMRVFLGSLKWADGSPVDPTMWHDWLAAVQMATSAGSCKIAAGR